MDPKKKPVKFGVRKGAGPPPGYQWDVKVLDQAYSDAMSFLDECQYRHMADQVRELAMETDPTHSAVIDVKAIDDYYEIRDKGGVLGKINVRVFFFVRKEPREMVVLGAIKKEKEGQTPLGTKILMGNRKRKYLTAFP
jgi:hypothetical protein